MKNLFLDTNVIIDFIADRNPFSDTASILFDLAERKHIRLFISALSYSNIYYIIRKNCSHKEMLNILQDLETIVETMDVTKKIIFNALKSDFSDFEDAIQYYTASSNNRIEAIITRDTKDYRKSEIAIFSPDEVLKIIENEIDY